MAKITVKNYQDPIFIEDARASKLKEKWMDPATDRTNIADLGSWTGLYSDIKSITLDSVAAECQHDWKPYGTLRSGDTVTGTLYQCTNCRKTRQETI